MASAIPGRGAWQGVRGTVLATNTLSSEIDLSDFSDAVGLITLTNATSGAITFMVSDTGDAAGAAALWADLKDASGNYSIGTQVNRFAVSGELLKPLAPYRFVRVKFAAAQTTGLDFIFLNKA